MKIRIRPRTVALSVLLLLAVAAASFFATGDVKFYWGFEHAGFATWHGSGGRRYRSLQFSWCDARLGIGGDPVCFVLNERGEPTNLVDGYRIIPRVRWTSVDFSTLNLTNR